MLKSADNELENVEKIFGGSLSNLVVLTGKVLHIFPSATTRKNSPKRKFILGYNRNRKYVITVCVVGDLVIQLDDISTDKRVRVLGTLHCATWEDEGQVKRQYEVHASALKSVD